MGAMTTPSVLIAPGASDTATSHSPKRCPSQAGRKPVSKTPHLLTTTLFLALTLIATTNSAALKIHNPSEQSAHPVYLHPPGCREGSASATAHFSDPSYNSTHRPSSYTSVTSPCKVSPPSRS